MKSKIEHFIIIYTFLCASAVKGISDSEKLISVNKFTQFLAQGKTIVEIPEHLLLPSDREGLENGSIVQFSLAEPKAPFKCDHGMYIINLNRNSVNLMNTSDAHVHARKYSYETESPTLNSTVLIENLQPYFFTSTGALTKILENKNQEYFLPDEYCINSISSSSIEVQVCPTDCGKYRPCVKKCCGPGLSFSMSTYSCQPSGPLQWDPVFYKDPHIKVPSGEIRPHFIKTDPSCQPNSVDGGLQIHPLRTITDANNETHEKISWRLMADSSILYLARSRKWTKLETENYCLDGILDFGEGEFYSGSVDDQVMILCLEDEIENNHSTLYVVFLFIASMFLLLTASVYILLFDKQNIHGWTVLCFCSSMFLMYVFLATARLIAMNRTYQEENGSPLCVTIGVVAHFFFLSTFCWLTLINFDLCWTFRLLTPGTGRSRGFKRFLGYLAFAWSIPLAVVITGLILDKEFPDLESEVIVPEYGQGKCFVTDTACGVYLYYIISALLTCNFLLISITVITIYRLRRNSKIVMSGRSTKHHQSFKLFAKLFVIMGVSWVFEILSWALGSSNKIEWYWVVFDMVNLLQSIAIFIIFVCKRSTLSQISSRIPLMKRILSWTQNSTSNQVDNPLQLEQKTSTSTTSGSSLYQKISQRFKPQNQTRF